MEDVYETNIWMRGWLRIVLNGHWAPNFHASYSICKHSVREQRGRPSWQEQRWVERFPYLKILISCSWMQPQIDTSLDGTSLFIGGRNPALAVKNSPTATWGGTGKLEGSRGQPEPEVAAPVEQKELPADGGQWMEQLVLHWPSGHQPSPSRRSCIDP